jgi:hypothetical protein
MVLVKSVTEAYGLFWSGSSGIKIHLKTEATENSYADFQLT